MMIQDLFERDIHRPINGVVKADQLDASSVWQELDEFVVTAELTRHITDVVSALNDDGKSLRGSRVLVLGIAYKPDIDDIRESPAAEIIETLAAGGADVAYHDPHVPTFPKMRKHDIHLASTPLEEETLAGYDCVLIVTDHSAVDYELVGRCTPLIVDSRNAMARVPGTVTARVVKA